MDVYVGVCMYMYIHIYMIYDILYCACEFNKTGHVEYTLTKRKPFSDRCPIDHRRSRRQTLHVAASVSARFRRSSLPFGFALGPTEPGSQVRQRSL